MERKVQTVGKKHVRIRRINFNTWFLESLRSGNGFVISEPPSVRIDGEVKKSLYGPRSYLYGTSYEDEQSYAERFRCECGAFKGRVFRGDKCPFCHTVVKEVGDDISITGWIDLGMYSIISPLYYQELASALGNTVFTEIVTARKKVDKNGHISTATIFEDKPPSSKYAGIGIDEFRQHFYEIMDYFKGEKKWKNRAAKIEKLERNARSIFISKLPVYSTKLRQQSMTADTFYYTGIDKHINSIYLVSRLLETADPIDLPNLLWTIQEKELAIWQYNFDLMNGKEGIIRDIILGGSLDEYLGEHINSFNCWKPAMRQSAAKTLIR